MPLVADQRPELSASEAFRLSTLTLDVLTTALAQALDTESVVAPHTRQRALMAKIQAFIRSNLADPLLAARTIRAIAARWGFTSPAHFSRAFRGAYALSPLQFRRQSAACALPVKYCALAGNDSLGRGHAS